MASHNFGARNLKSRCLEHCALFRERPERTFYVCLYQPLLERCAKSYYFLLQGIFLTQESDPHLFCLLHWQAGSLPLVPPGKLVVSIPGLVALLLLSLPLPWHGFLSSVCVFFLVSLIRTYLDLGGTPLQYSCLENPMDRGAW